MANSERCPRLSCRVPSWAFFRLSLLPPFSFSTDAPVSNEEKLGFRLCWVLPLFLLFVAVVRVSRASPSPFYLGCFRPQRFGGWPWSLAPCPRTFVFYGSLFPFCFPDHFSLDYKRNTASRLALHYVEILSEVGGCLSDGGTFSACFVPMVNTGPLRDTAEGLFFVRHCPPLVLRFPFPFRFFGSWPPALPGVHLSNVDFFTQSLPPPPLFSLRFLPSFVLVL